MASRAFGIDFGTTNSLVATVAGGGVQCLTEGDRPHPSVVWYRGSDIIVGREAREQLAQTDRTIVGDFVVSPKRLLGETAVQFVGGRRLSPEEIAAEVLGFLKRDAEARFGPEYQPQRAVMTIPVSMDGRGRRALRLAAARVGINIIQFVHEPLAALYAWIRVQPEPEAWAARLRGRPILVFDWGGGTLDLTLCVIEDGRLLQIANAGDATVGGDMFDQRLASLVRQQHALEHGLGSVEGGETEGAANRLRARCELAKINLSSRGTASVVVTQYLPGSSAPDLAVQVSRAKLLAKTRDLLQRGMSTIDRVLEKAGCRREAIDLVIPTGGMVEMPAVRDALTERFEGRVADIGKYSRGDRMIAEGAAWLAADGARLALSKSLEVEEADGEYADLLTAGAIVPEVDARYPSRKLLYCVDPARGEAAIRFAIREGLGAFGRPEARRKLDLCMVPVAAECQPFVETIEADIRLDRDCIAQMAFQGSVRKAPPVRAEVFDLEFGITLPWREHDQERQVELETSKPLSQTSAVKARDSGQVRIRSNVASTKNWRAVPGEVAKHYEPGFFDVRVAQYSDRQLMQFLAHARCKRCDRRDDVIWSKGCEYCGKGARGRMLPGGHLREISEKTQA